MGRRRTDLPIDDLPRSPRGFRIFATQEHRGLRVTESSLAAKGAHCWIFVDDAAGYPEQAIQLSVEDAKLVLSGLAHFLAEAENGKLTEPAAV